MDNWHLEAQQLLHHSTKPRLGVCTRISAPLKNTSPEAVGAQRTPENSLRAATLSPDLLSMLLCCTAPGPQVLPGSAAHNSLCK